MLFFEKKAELITLLPERLRDIPEFKQICGCVGNEIDSANRFISETADNCFAADANEKGLIRWEKILGVSTPLNATEEARREAVLAKLITKPPINLAVVRGIIEAYMGVAVEITVYRYKISVKYRGESRVTDLVPLLVTVYGIIPANMVAEISYKFLVWSELDSVGVSFESLDSEQLTWQNFEKGEWLNG